MYAKVFSSLWDGTLGQHHTAWSLFVFMLAHANQDGIVEMTQEAMAARSGIPLHLVREALKKLEAEDPRSRSQEEGGRRLIPIDKRGWGWKIVNHPHYRSLRDEDQRRTEARERMRKLRAQAMLPDVRHGSPSFAHTDADTDTEESKKRARKAARVPTLTISAEQRRAAAAKYGLEMIWIEAAANRIEAEAAAGKYVSAPGALHTWCANELRYRRERGNAPGGQNPSDRDAVSTHPDFLAGKLERERVLGELAKS